VTPPTLRNSADQSAAPDLDREATGTRRVAALLLLCPLFAVSDSVINALGLSVVAMLVTIVASVPMSVALLRLPEFGRIAAAVITVSAVVTSALLLTHAWFYDLYLAIGTYIPLLVFGGLMISRFEVTAPHERQGALIIAGLKTGIAFSSALIALGAVREFVGHGSVFFGAAALPRAWIHALNIDKLDTLFFRSDMGFVLAILPPGAFIAMGLLLAIRNRIFPHKGLR
jgi:electron transport complex protein RnfE